MSQRKKIAKNTAHMYLRMLVVLGAGLYSVRVLLSALGVEDFGIYALTGGMVAIFAFLNATMTRAAQRFLGVEIGHGAPEALAKTFNAVLAINVLIAVIVILVGLTVGSWLVNHKFNIPAQRISAANAVLLMTIGTTVALILRTPFSALIISHQRMSFFSTTSILEALLKLGIAFVISTSAGDRLEIYALLIALAGWAMLACYVLFCYIKFPESRIKPHRDWNLYRTLADFIGWSFIGNLAHVLRTQGVNLLLNLHFGPSLNAAYGVMMQAQGAASQFTNSFEVALSPQIYKSYGQGNRNDVHELVVLGCKLNFMLFALVATPAIYGVDLLLEIWLGHPLPYLSAFVSWMLVLQLIETMSQPLMVAAMATGAIRRYQMVVGGAVALNFPLSAAVFQVYPDPHGFLYVAFLLQLVTFILRAVFMRTMLRIPLSDLLLRVFLPLSMIGLFALILIETAWLVLPPAETITQALPRMAALSALLMAACFLIGLDRSEKVELLAIIRRKMRRS